MAELGYIETISKHCSHLNFNVCIVVRLMGKRTETNFFETHYLFFEFFFSHINYTLTYITEDIDLEENQHFLSLSTDFI